MNKPFFILLFLLQILSPDRVTSQVQASPFVKRVQQSIVVIQTYDTFGAKVARGNGFFIDPNGEVITNRHILLGADRAEIRTADGAVYQAADIVSEMIEGDLIRIAVNIPLKEVHPIGIAAKNPVMGEHVMLVNSADEKFKVIEGIITGVKEIPSFQQRIKTTIAIDRNASGSPVVNAQGGVIGVATYQTIDNENLSAVIACNKIARVGGGVGKSLSSWEGNNTRQWLSSVKGLYGTGFMFFWGEKYQKAVEYFEKAVQVDPQFADGFFQIGYCQKELGRMTQAIESYKHVTQIQPSYAEAYENMGLTYGKMGLNNDAVDALKHAILVKPDYPSAYYSLGVMYSRLSRHTEAVDAFNEAVRLKPDYADALYNMGVEYGILGQSPQEIKSYQAAIRISPDFAMAYSNLGIAYSKVNRYPQAISAFKQVVRITPKNAEAYFNLGATYRKSGRDTVAVEALQKAVKLKPDFLKAYLNLGMIHGEHSRNDEAAKAFQEAIRIDPNSADSHYLLGGIYVVLKNSGAAVQEYGILQKLDKDLAEKLYKHISR